MNIPIVHVSILLGTLVLNQALAAQDADKIGEQLATAVSTFGETQTKISEELISAIDKALKRAETNKKLSVERRIEIVEELQIARKAFVEKDLMPEIKSLRAATKNFERKLNRAKSKCVSAYQDAAERYGKANDLESAKRVLAELEDFQEQNADSEYDALENPALWFGKVSDKVKNSDEMKRLKNQLSNLDYNGQFLVYQHDGRAGRQYHCLISGGNVIRHREGISQWQVKDGVFYKTTRIGDKSWITRWNFNADQTRFEAINQNSKTSKGVLIYGDPKEFFNKELGR